jgi:hypothetical protein
MVNKNIKIDTKDKSFLYIFYLNDSTSKSIKIGVATHSKTGSSIKLWEKYAESDHPVTIVRRITDLQTGNPIQIKPLAYFLYHSKGAARKIENKLHRHFDDKKHEHTREWFELSEQDVKDIISSFDAKSNYKIFDCESTHDFWVEQNSHWKIK